MSQNGDPRDRRGWSNSVAFRRGTNGFAHAPGELIVAGKQGLKLARQRYKHFFAAEPEGSLGSGGFMKLTVKEDADHLNIVRELRLEGVVAQPNHVLFAHGDCCCGPHPALLWQTCFGGSAVSGAPVAGSPGGGAPVSGSPLYGSPLYGSALYGSPLYGSSLSGSPVSTPALYGSPLYGSPVYGSPAYAPAGSNYQSTGIRHSSAVPCAAPALATSDARERPSTGRPRVVILDTGLAENRQCPPSLHFVMHSESGWKDAPAREPDGYLDPAVGHGTFIAGLINQLAPGCEIAIVKVLTELGAGDEWLIAEAIDTLPEHDLLNLSFGGHALWDMSRLETSIARLRAKGTVIVASAGNDATCRPCYPAAFDDVVGVAALGPNGPAAFSNYGSWVGACAPGVDLVSTFFMDARGPEPAPVGYPEPDRYRGWARWSGTSFSTPIVVAALARAMQRREISADDAVAQVIDGPALLRIPGFGTVVNIQ